MASDSTEGIVSGDSRIGSIARTQVVDLISEGEIDGLVTQEYNFVGVAGKTGYDSATISKEKSFLASIFFNEVPIVDEQGLFNFQDVNIKESFGTKTGSTNDDTRTSEQLEKVKAISERLRGPTQNGTDFPSDDEDYFAKYYRIFNTDCSSAKIAIRVSALSTTDTSNGTVQDNTVKITIQARALYTDKTESYIDYVSSEGEGEIKGRISSPFLKPYKIIKS
jgi:predicted phage tail protein